MGEDFVKWLCRNYAKNRFPIFTEEEGEAIGNYIGAISYLHGSGEYALNTILEFGAYARNPLEKRIGTEMKVPLSFVYGEDDWMDW